MRWLLPILLVACTTQTDPAGPGARRGCTTFTAVDASTSAFTWQHSDVEESGDVYCAAGAVLDAGSAATRGTYDATSQQLVWDAVTYAP